MCLIPFEFCWGLSQLPEGGEGDYVEMKAGFNAGRDDAEKKRNAAA
jgi:hypothetical protein